MALVAMLGLFLMGATALTAVAAGADTAGPASGDGIIPTLIADNPTCEGQGFDNGLKVDQEGAPDGQYELLPSLPGEFVTILNSTGTFFDWEATVGIDAVIVKGGDNADSFVYVPADNDDDADTILHAPFKDDGTTARDISHVEFCFGGEPPPPDALPPTVAKDAAGTYDDAYTWDITKAVDGEDSVSTAASTAKFTYTVNVQHSDSAPSNGKVTGTIGVTNPNSESVDITSVTDQLSDTTTCAVTVDDLQLDPGLNNFPYECVNVDVSGGVPADLTNTATVTWPGQTLDGGSQLAAGSDDVTTDVIGFTPGEIVDECVDVVDDMSGQAQIVLGQACVGGANPTTFTYSRDVPVVPNTCTSYDNTATSTTNDTETTDDASASVDVCGPVTGGLTIGFWQNKNGQDIIKTGAAPYGVCASGTELRKYDAGPFRDLSATATCSQVATYVTGVIKAANASGASMNAMLKAQMLATALDVFFPGNVDGTVNVDLTKIPKPVTSANLENTSGAFNPPPTVVPHGDTCLSVNELLTYAASQSSSIGSPWYGQVKATQELAKDTFDAINNRKAVTCV